VTCRVDNGFGDYSQVWPRPVLLDEVADDAIATGESPRDDLAVQHRCFEAPAGDPFG
jgi:hypothetical protein